MGESWRFAAILATALGLGAACTFELADVATAPAGSSDAGGTNVPPSRGALPPPGAPPPGDGPPPNPAPPPPPFDSGVVRFNGPCTCASASAGGGECPGAAAGCGWDLKCVYYADMGGRGACVGPKCCDNAEACDADAGARGECDQGACRSGKSAAFDCYSVCQAKATECGYDQQDFCEGCFLFNGTLEQVTCLRHKTCAELGSAPSGYTTQCPRNNGVTDYYCR